MPAGWSQGMFLELKGHRTGRSEERVLVEVKGGIKGVDDAVMVRAEQGEVAQGIITAAAQPADVMRLTDLNVSGRSPGAYLTATAVQRPQSAHQGSAPARLLTQVATTLHAQHWSLLNQCRDQTVVGSLPGLLQRAFIDEGGTRFQRESSRKNTEEGVVGSG